MPEFSDPLSNVSRETLEKLRAFQDLVQKWTKRINLISPRDLNELWDRHIRDSAQVYGFADPSTHWIDLGSGGGFPGIVVAILLNGEQYPAKVTLVESDRRKCTFLKSVARELDLDVTVAPTRIEQYSGDPADTVSARALAPLDKLLSYTFPLLTPDGQAVFPKGASWEKELIFARKFWQFDVSVVKSITHAEAAVLYLKNIRQRAD